jgi:phosphoribosylformylglycinamidine synthase
MKPKWMILTGVGINSNRELAEAFELAGAESVQVHMSELENNPASLKDYQGLAFPGGFSFGDHIASGKILGNLIKSKLGDQLQALASSGLPMIGICNGFQILVKMGLLPQMDDQVKQEASLVHNNSAKYEDRWVQLKINKSAQEKSPWLKGIDLLDCPVRHGEGKLVLSNEDELKRLHELGLVALQYSKGGDICADYPHNPNGSWDSIAGLISPNGMIFGLMPHPEVAIHRIQTPDWHRQKNSSETTPCLQLFKNIVDYQK